MRRPLARPHGADVPTKKCMSVRVQYPRHLRECNHCVSTDSYACTNEAQLVRWSTGPRAPDSFLGGCGGPPKEVTHPMFALFSSLHGFGHSTRACDVFLPG